MLKILYLILGTLFLGLGLIGVVLPILPTTPFLLLTAYFYAKGSERFHQWFIRSWVYQRYLKDFVDHKAMTLKAKLKLMGFVDAMLMFPFFILSYGWVKPLIIGLILIKYCYFFKVVKTITPEEASLNKSMISYKKTA